MHSIVNKEWYALYVKPHAEHTVADGLAYLEIEHFLPLYRARSRPCNRQSTEERVLFPRYVFCNTDLVHGPKMYTVPGVIEIVSRSRVPISVQQQEIDMIRQITSGASSVASHEGMIAGEEVMVVRGPLRGIKGVYISADGGSQIIVSFPLLRRAVNIKIDPDWIEKSNDGVLMTSLSA